MVRVENLWPRRATSLNIYSRLAKSTLSLTFALTDKSASCGTEVISQRTVELRRHSCSHWFGFAQCRDLQEHGRWLYSRMVVRQEIESHGRNLGQKFIKCRLVCRRRDVVAVTAPIRGFRVSYS